MSSLILNTPVEGEEIVLLINDTITGFTLNFFLDEAIFEKVDDTLTIYFDEVGASIVLDDFYAVYHEEFLPDFMLDGDLIAGADFFEAFDPDLMPSMGYMQFYSNRNNLARQAQMLADGTDSLDGTMGESGYEAEGQLSDAEGTNGDGGNSVNTSGGRFNRDQEIADPYTRPDDFEVTPSEPTLPTIPPAPTPQPRPEVIPTPEPTPTPPVPSVDLAPELNFTDSNTSSSKGTTYDDINDSRDADVDADDNARTHEGSFIFTPGDGETSATITAPNGESITITVNPDGSCSVSSDSLEGEFGSLTVTYNKETGTVDYIYTQTENVTHETSESPKDIFDIKVSDSDGNPDDDASGSIEITIVDDIPTFNDENNDFPELNTNTPSISFDLDDVVDFGGDGKAPNDGIILTVPSDGGYTLEDGVLSYNGEEIGTVTVNPDDNTITIEKNETADEAFKGQELPQLSIDVTVKDSDGSTASGSLDATLDFSYGDNNDSKEDGKGDIKVEITTDGDDNIISKEELDGNDGKIEADITLGKDVSDDDDIIIKDQSGNEIFTGTVGDLKDKFPPAEDGKITITFDPPTDGKTQPSINVTVTDEDGNSTSDSDSTNIDTTVSSDLEGNTVSSNDNSFAENVIVDGIVLDADAKYSFGEEFILRQDGNETPYGKFTVDADGNLLFTQTAPYIHPTGNGNTATTVTVDVPVVDALGNEGTVRVTVTIGDSDVTASATLDSEISNMEQAEGTITFESADGITRLTLEGKEVLLENGMPKAGTVVSVTNGSVEFGDNGSYTFTPNAGYIGSVNLDFIATDSDGDSTTHSEVIEVSGNLAPTANDIILGVTDSEGNRSDTESTAASDSDGDTLSYNITGGDITSGDTTGGANLDNYGSLTSNGDGSFTFELNDAVASLGKDETLTGAYNVTVSDGRGGFDEVTVTVNITGTNDKPSVTTESENLKIAVDDSDLLSTANGALTFTSAETMAGGKITIAGKEYSITQNDDGTFSCAEVAEVNDSIGKSTYGKLGISALKLVDPETGEYKLEYTYTQVTPYHHSEAGNNDETQANADSFTIEIQDGKEAKDGGESVSVTVNVDIKDDGVEILTADGNSYTENEISITTSYKTEYHIFNGDDYITTRILSADEVGNIWGITLGNGGTRYTVGSFVAVETGTVSALTCQTSKAVEVEGVKSATISGNVEGQSADGLKSFTVDVLRPPKNGTDDFIEIDGDPIKISASRDGSTFTASMNGVDYFTLEFDSATGKWEFKQFTEFSSSVVLKFSATDNDGDSDTQYIEIKPATEGFGALMTETTDVTVYEAGLLDDAIHTETAKGQISVKSADGLDEITVVGADGEAVVIAEWDAEANSWVYKSASMDGANIKITSVIGNAQDGYAIEYDYTLTAPVTGAGETNHQTSFDITFKDLKGDVSSGKVDITVVDDTPEASKARPIVEEESGRATQNLISVDFGADAMGGSFTVNGIVATWNGSEWSGAEAQTLEGCTILTFGDVTLKSTNGVDWLAETKQSAGETSKTTTILVKDADGDPQTIEYENTWFESDMGELLSLMSERSMPPANPVDDNNIVNGTDGDDTLYANDNDVLNIAEGETFFSQGTTISGGAGDDRLIGGIYEDVLLGGSCNDTLEGGDGADNLIWKLEDFAHGDVDVAVDFNVEEDTLDLSALKTEGYTFEVVANEEISGYDILISNDDEEPQSQTISLNDVDESIKSDELEAALNTTGVFGG